MEKAPFRFRDEPSKEKYVIVGAVVTSNEDWSEERTEELLSVSLVVNAHPILITEKRETCSNDLMHVCADELGLMRSPLDLVSSI